MVAVQNVEGSSPFSRFADVPAYSHVAGARDQPVDTATGALFTPGNQNRCQ
jgi:hypothetical protein